MPRSVRRRATDPGRSRASPVERHWEGIYRGRPESELSWHQRSPSLSLRLVRKYAAAGARILDAGGGSSTLPGRLVAAGFHRVSVVDVSGTGLRRGRARASPGPRDARRVRADLLHPPRLGKFDLWHDRAFFHFLTRPRDRAVYVRLVRRSLTPEGVAIVATFATDGPDTCSGLPVHRYDAPGLRRAFGPGFALVESLREVHRTPWGTVQPFTYAVLRYRGGGARRRAAPGAGPGRARTGSARRRAGTGRAPRSARRAA